MLLWCERLAQPDPAAFYALPTWLQDEWLAYLRADLSGKFKGKPTKPRRRQRR